MRAVAFVMAGRRMRTMYQNTMYQK